MFVGRTLRLPSWSVVLRRRNVGTSGSGAIIAGTEGATYGYPAAGTAHHIRMRSGFNTAGYTAMVDGYWWKGTGAKVGLMVSREAKLCCEGAVGLRFCV